MKGPDGGWVIEQASRAENSSPGMPQFLAIAKQRPRRRYSRRSPGIGHRTTSQAAREVTLTDKSGKKIEIQISAATGNSVYAQDKQRPRSPKARKINPRRSKFAPQQDCTTKVGEGFLVRQKFGGSPPAFRPAVE